MEATNDCIKDELDTTKKEVAVIKSDFSIHKTAVEKQFQQTERAQIESRDLILRQVDEIKKIIQGVSDRLDSFLKEIQDLHLKVVEHVARSEGKDE